MLEIPDRLLVAVHHLCNIIVNDTLTAQRIHHPIDRIVLQVGDDDMVARTNQTLDCRVDGLGAVFGKDHLLGLTPKQSRGALPASVDFARSLN